MVVFSFVVLGAFEVTGASVVGGTVVVGATVVDVVVVVGAIDVVVVVVVVVVGAIDVVAGVAVVLVHAVSSASVVMVSAVNRFMGNVSSPSGRTPSRSCSPEWRCACNRTPRLGVRIDSCQTTLDRCPSKEKAHCRTKRASHREPCTSPKKHPVSVSQLSFRFPGRWLGFLTLRLRTRLRSLPAGGCLLLARRWFLVLW